MPTIKRFAGFVIRMYFSDENPPHVHVEGADFRARVSINDASVLAGDIPPKFSKEALSWIEKNRAQLLKRWAEYS
jgi:hypothetical protein